MKICFECSEYPPGPHGGIGTLVQMLARGLANAGHQVRVVGIYPATYPGKFYGEDQGVRVWRFRQSPHRFGWIMDRLRLFRLISKWSRNGEVDLIEVPDYGAPSAWWPRLSVPVVTRLSGSASFFATEMGGPLKRVFYLERASLRRADFWCSESKYMAEQTRELYCLRSNPAAIIYNPVEMPPLSPWNDRLGNRVVFAGTLTQKKGVVQLIKCWPRVVASCGKAELHIFGKDGRAKDGGSMQRYLELQIPEAVASSVYFHGHVTLDKLVKEFHFARVVVLPSYAEGFALTPMHSMAAGCPTIYTVRGSGPELIEHGRDGLLVDPDNVEEIADAITGLLKNEETAKELGAAGRRRIQKDFSFSTLLSQNESFFSQCIADFQEKLRSR